MFDLTVQDLAGLQADRLKVPLGVKKPTYAGSDEAHINAEEVVSFVTSMPGSNWLQNTPPIVAL